MLAAGRMWDEAKNISALDARRAAAAVAGAASPATRRGGGRRPPARPARPAPGVARALAARAAIYALPARYEPFGLTALEAALAGCALVLGDIPSLREIWGDAALFVRPADDGALRGGAAIADRRPWRCARRRGRAHAPRRSPTPPEPWRRRTSAAYAHVGRAREHGEARREDRRLLPLAGLRLEPRQRALPARRRPRAARPRPRRAVYEPRDGWSRENLVAEHGEQRARGLPPTPIPSSQSTRYELETLDLDARSTAPTSCSCTSGTTPSSCAASASTAARRGRYRLLFHDTHHRSVTEPEEMARYDLAALRRRARVRRA